MYVRHRYRFGANYKAELLVKTPKGHRAGTKYKLTIERVGSRVKIVEDGVTLKDGDMSFEDNQIPPNFNMQAKRGWHLAGMPDLSNPQVSQEVAFSMGVSMCVSDFAIDGGSKVDFMPLLGTETATKTGGLMSLNCDLPQ